MTYGYPPRSRYGAGHPYRPKTCPDQSPQDEYIKSYLGDTCTVLAFCQRSKSVFSLPSMNKAMSCHSSTIVGQALYVYGGNMTREIERLDIVSEQSAAAWQKIKIERDYTLCYQRNWPLLCEVNETTLLISGGILSKFGELRDQFLLYDTETGEITTKESM